MMRIFTIFSVLFAFAAFATFGINVVAQESCKVTEECGDKIKDAAVGKYPKVAREVFTSRGSKERVSGVREYLDNLTDQIGKCIDCATGSAGSDNEGGAIEQ